MLRLIKRVLRMAGPLKRKIQLGFLFGFVEGLFNIVTLAAIFYALQSYSRGIGTGDIMTVVILLAVGLAGRVVFRYLVARFQSGTGFEMTARERLRLGMLLRDAPMSFFDSNEQGDLAACMTTDLNFVEMYVMFILDKIVNGFLMTIATGIFLFLFDWRVGAAALLALLPSIATFILLQKRGKKLGPLRQNTQAELGAAVLEYAQGILTAKAYGVKGESTKRIAKAFHDSNEASYRVERGFVGGVAAFNIIVRLASCSVVFVSSLAALSGQFELPIYLMMLVAAMVMFSGFEQSVSKIPMLRIMEASLDRIGRISELQTQTEWEQTEMLPRQFDLSFERVSFGYGKEQVLQNVSFQIPERSITALVGPSGSGKSTIMKLISGFYDCGEGLIKIGGLDIRKIPRAQLFSYISVVFQNVYLFEDTVANNIRLGKPDATMEEVICAAKKACCYQFIMEMGGFNTVIGEGGNTLSGGQKQRISIARAILKDSPVILLDEATSNVDPENEQQIQRAINHLVRDKTVLVIAHNLSAVRDADKILVFRNGKLEEEGDHSSLLRGKGLYHELWRISEQVHFWEA